MNDELVGAHPVRDRLSHGASNSIAHSVRSYRFTGDLNA
jgi:hypothetical protein